MSWRFVNVDFPLKKPKYYYWYSSYKEDIDSLYCESKKAFIRKGLGMIWTYYHEQDVNITNLMVFQRNKKLSAC